MAVGAGTGGMAERFDWKEGGHTFVRRNCVAEELALC